MLHDDRGQQRLQQDSTGSGAFVQVMIGLKNSSDVIVL
jgi:hypothetical protein